MADEQPQPDWPFYYRILNGWDFLTVRDVAEWLNIPRRKVQIYVELGLIRSRTSAPGTGNARKFSLTDLTLFALFNRLDGLGIAPRFLRSISSEVNEIFRGPVSEPGDRPLYLVIEPNTGGSMVVRSVRVEQLSEALSSPGAIFVNAATLESDTLLRFAERMPASSEAQTLLATLRRPSP